MRTSALPKRARTSEACSSTAFATSQRRPPGAEVAEGRVDEALGDLEAAEVGRVREDAVEGTSSSGERIGGGDRLDRGRDGVRGGVLRASATARTFESTRTTEDSGSHGRGGDAEDPDAAADVEEAARAGEVGDGEQRLAPVIDVTVGEDAGARAEREIAPRERQSAPRASGPSSAGSARRRSRADDRADADSPRPRRCGRRRAPPS